MSHLRACQNGTAKTQRRTEECLTNEVAILVRFDARLFHSLVEHFCVRLAVELVRSVVAVGDALEEIVDTQKLDNALSVVDVGIGEEPHPYFARVYVLEQRAQFRVWLDDVFQRQRVVDLCIILQSVYLVVSDQAFNGQAILPVVLVVQLVGLFLRQ